MRSRPPLLDRRRFLALGGAALLAGPATAARVGAAPVSELGGAAFGSTWSVTLPAGQATPRLHAQISELLDGLDRAFSPWRADSVIGRFNATEAQDFAVSEEIADVTRAALGIAEASGGRFDPTVGPLVARWGFGPILTGEAQAEGWRGITAGTGHLAKAGRGLTLDLCGIAKGHALDRMVTLLREAGHDDFLVDLGGELVARGRHPSGRPWQVGVEDPRPEADGLYAALRLEEAAIATSGSRANGYDVGGRRYSHIIDPATGEPVATSLASVSVLMPTAREADGWATALMAAGADGPDMARRLGLSALFLIREETGLGAIATGTFERHLS
jgi:Membrane-associated lipoprotein involved in thiamine biosynthesis